MKGKNLLVGFALVVLGLAFTGPAPAQVVTNLSVHPAVGETPISLIEALNFAERQNGTIIKGRKDLEASAGVIIQTKAILNPKLQTKTGYQLQSPGSLETVPLPQPYTINIPDQSWNASVLLVQSIYEGGRLSSSVRTARLTREQAIAQYQTVLNDTLLGVRTTYYDVLLAQQQIAVEEASVQLLTSELDDTTKRFNAGTVPSFNVLRARVELANERPRLIKARNNYRVAKDNLVNLMGFNTPHGASEDVNLHLSGRLEAAPFTGELGGLIDLARKARPELVNLSRSEKLRREDLITAKSGTRPSVQVYGGYASHNSQFSTDFLRDVSGWEAGVQASWNIFDGYLTHGKVVQARALMERAEADLEDAERRVELEVRTAYSDLIEAREVQESQIKVVEEAEESLRLASSRSEAGAGTQLDVLNAQTALLQARTTQIESTHDYVVALAKLEHAVGQSIPSRP